MSEDAPAPKRRLPMQIVLPALALLLGAGGGFAGAFFFGPAAAAEKGGGEGEAAAEGEAAPEGEAAKEGEGEGEKKEAEAEGGHGEGGGEGEGAKKAANPNESAVTSLGTFTVNLRGNGGGRVLRLEVQVEAKGNPEAVTSHVPQIRDAIITAASDYTWSELEGTEGKTRLRDELLARVNGATAPTVVDHIYFTQFVVQ